MRGSPNQFGAGMANYNGTKVRTPCWHAAMLCVVVCSTCRYSWGICRSEPTNGISGISLRAAVIAHGGACRAPSHHSLPHFAPICPLQACVLFSSNLRQPSSALVSPSSICQLYFGLRRPASDRAKTCRQHTISRALDRNVRARYRGMPKLQSRDPLFVMDAHCQEY